MSVLSAIPSSALRKKPYTLRFWIFLVFGCLSVVLLVSLILVRSFGIPVLGINGAYQDMKIMAAENFSLLADLKKEHLQFWVRERRDDLGLLAENPDVKLSIAKISQAARGGAQPTDLAAMPEFRHMENRLGNMVKTYPSFEALHVIDAVTGVIVASSSRQFLGRFPEGEAEFKAFMDSRLDCGAWFSPGGDHHDSHLKMARLVTGPDDRDNPVAMLVARVSIEEILLPMLLKGKGLGKSGEIILVDYDQRILTPLGYPLPDGKEARVGEYRIESLPSRLASRGKEGVIFADDYRGVPVLACFRHVKIEGDRGWGMVVKQDESEMLEPIWHQMYHSLLLGLAGILVALGGCAIFAGYLAAPLQVLTRAASGLKDGDFSRRVPRISSYREVMELSSTFNKMGERLMEWDASLNREIALKTRQLTEELAVRRQAEEALRESEQTLNTIFEAALDGILVADGESRRFVRWNGAICRMLGYPPEEMGKLSVSDIHPAQDLPRVVDVFERQLRGEISLAQDIPLKRKDGTVFPSEVNSSPLLLFRRPHLLGIFRDITERKQTEAERERLMAAVEHAGETILVTGPDGAIEYVNPAFEYTSGYSFEEVIGRNPRILKSGRQDESFYRDLWTAISSGRIWKGRIINKRKDGTLYAEEATISPVLDPSGRIVNYVAVKRDITQQLRESEEKARLEEELRQAQKMESIGRLAGGVAHDFNNMLGIILGYGESILGQLHLGDPLRKEVREIVDAGQRSAALTRQLLAFSRKQALRPEIVDLNAIVRNLERMLRRVIGEDIALELRPAENLAPVMADPGQMEQVVMNLAINARDAMPQGGRLSIETANADLDETYAQGHAGVKPGRYVMLAIADTGSGMDKETLGKIFEPFFTTKERGKGTGLGLATVFGIVKQSGGDIWAYSEPGLGSTFKVYLPRIEAEEDTKETAMEKGDLGVGKEHILVVEDEKSLRMLLDKMLSRLGYQVTSAADGGEALELLEKTALNPDLVITDVVMPGMSGSMLARRLLKTLPGLKILYISGYTDDAIVHHGVLEEGVQFIQKPFSLRALAAKVREVLEEGK